MNEDQSPVPPPLPTPENSAKSTDRPPLPMPETDIAGPPPPPLPPLPGGLQNEGSYLPGDYPYSAAPPPPKKPSLWDIPKSVVIIIGLQFLIGVALGIVHVTKHGKGEPFQMTDAIAWTMPVFSLSLLFTSWWYRCRKYGRTFADGLALRKPTKRATWTALALAIGMGILMLGLTFVMHNVNSSALDDAPITQLLSTSDGMLLFAVMALLGAPFEEFFFRGFIYPLLKTRLGSIASITITSIFFALVHAFQLGGDLPSLSIILAVGIVLTLQRHYTGSLIPGIITHTVYNSMFALLLAAAALFGPQHAEPTEPVLHSDKPTVEQMKVDLQGHRIGKGVKSWNFDSVDEFKSFEILEEHETETAYRIKADIGLDGVIGPDATARIIIRYDREQDGYRFSEVTDGGTLALD